MSAVGDLLQNTQKLNPLCSKTCLRSMGLAPILTVCETEGARCKVIAALCGDNGALLALGNKALRALSIAMGQHSDDSSEPPSKHQGTSNEVCIFFIESVLLEPTENASNRAFVKHMTSKTEAMKPATMTEAVPAPVDIIEAAPACDANSQDNSNEAGRAGEKKIKYAYRSKKVAVQFGQLSYAIAQYQTKSLCAGDDLLGEQAKMMDALKKMQKTIRGMVAAEEALKSSSSSSSSSSVS